MSLTVTARAHNTMSHDRKTTGRRGERLLTAVERLVREPGELIEAVEILKYDDDGPESDPAYHRAIATKLISIYSTRSALGGALTAIPSLFPGAGTLLATVGGSMADMAWMLKQEVEMALSLSYLHGYDIRDERERWLAYGLASVSTYEAEAGRNYFADLAETQVEAMVKYTPRELSKLVATHFGRLALARAGRGFVRGIPLVGVAVGVAGNKLLTSAVGWRCVSALGRRRSVDDGEIVEARLRE